MKITIWIVWQFSFLWCGGFSFTQHFNIMISDRKHMKLWHPAPSLCPPPLPTVKQFSRSGCHNLKWTKLLWKNILIIFRYSFELKLLLNKAFEWEVFQAQIKRKWKCMFNLQILIEVKHPVWQTPLYLPPLTRTGTPVGCLIFRYYTLSSNL